MERATRNLNRHAHQEMLIFTDEIPHSVRDVIADAHGTRIADDGFPGGARGNILPGHHSHSIVSMLCNPLSIQEFAEANFGFTVAFTVKKSPLFDFARLIERFARQQLLCIHCCVRHRTTVSETQAARSTRNSDCRRRSARKYSRTLRILEACHHAHQVLPRVSS